MRNSSLLFYSVAFCVTLYLAVPASAFGAGNIPSYGYLEGHAFRHGDIEDTLANLAMRHGGVSSFLHKMGFGTGNFGSLMIKRVYFGNWLRDFSQAVDVGTLSRGISKGSIRMLVWVMSFLAHGYGTEEFEVTDDRLGVYRAEEHIDNPKDYADNKDARQYDDRLRGPVDADELDIDHRTGMKNYIANESGQWATSSVFIKESLYKAIHLGRQFEATGDHTAQYEALRLLGQSLHTLEDLPAHSNWCELALYELGYTNVFPHVGEHTKVNIRGKSIFPLVTGTFGGMDFVHSLLGEASDHISQTQIDDVSSAVTNAGSGDQGIVGRLRNLFLQLPGQGRRGGQSDRDISAERDLASELDQLENDRVNHQNQMQSGQLNLDSLSAEEIARRIYPVFKFRDRVMKSIEGGMDKVPGLNALTEKVTDSLTTWVLSFVQPYITPIIQQINEKLSSGSALVTSSEAQYAVFDNPTASDPTHSMLSKDHFSTYLNEPAGLVAVEIVKFAVSLVVQAWSDRSLDATRVVEDITQVFVHPALLDRQIPVHMAMFEVMRSWVNTIEQRDVVLEGLSKPGVRAGRNHYNTKDPNSFNQHKIPMSQSQYAFMNSSVSQQAQGTNNYPSSSSSPPQAGGYTSSRPHTASYPQQPKPEQNSGSGRTSHNSHHSQHQYAPPPGPPPDHQQSYHHQSHHQRPSDAPYPSNNASSTSYYQQYPQQSPYPQYPAQPSYPQYPPYPQPPSYPNAPAQPPDPYNQYYAR